MLKTTARLALAILSVCCCHAQGYAPAVHWAFEDTSDTQVADGSGHGHNLQSSGVERVPGAIGKGLRFKGGASSVTGPMAARLQAPKAVTVEAWVRADSIPPGSEGLGLVNMGHYLMRITRGTPSFHIYTTHWRPVYAEGPMREGQWYHLVGTYNGAEMCIYVNGELSGARERTGDIGHSKYPMILGRQANPFTGVLDEVKIYLTCFSEADVRAAYDESTGRLNPDVRNGVLRQPHEEFFGATRDRPAPLPTMAHLPPADLTFAVVTDTHIGTAKEEHRYCHPWRVEEALRQVDALKPDFLVNCGDIITAFPYHEDFEAQCANAVQLMKQCRIPHFVVPGNHDVGNQRTMRAWGENWSKRSGKPLEVLLFNERYRDVYSKYFGKDFFAFDRRGCRFIILDDQICNSGGALEAEQLQWFGNQLKTAGTGSKVFVFSHNPLFWNRIDEPGPGNYEAVLPPARQQLLDLIAAHDVDAVYTGHTHFGFANSYEGVWLRTINSTTFNRTFPGIAPKLPGEARIYDPYQIGFLIVRVAGNARHESWVNTYWRVHEPPEPLARIAGARLLGRPAAEVNGSILAVQSPIPQPFVMPNGGREGINDHRWRLAEEIGCQWLQVWPPPGPREDWEALERALTTGRPKAVKIALPLPMHPKAMDAVWSRLARRRNAIDAIMLCTGLPMNPSAPLASWRPTTALASWPEACSEARRRIGKECRLILARLPLLGDTALAVLDTVADAVQPHADAIAVWVDLREPPEGRLEEQLREAQATCAEHGLELWLDASGWNSSAPALRSACFLRLLALCQALGVRLTWWSTASDACALLDEHLDPTELFYAAQAWHSAVDAAVAGAAEATDGNVRSLRWRDSSGRPYVAWWQPDAEQDAVTTAELELPEKAIVIDPLHARMLHLPEAPTVPVTCWPLVARGEAEKGPTGDKDR